MDREKKEVKRAAIPKVCLSFGGVFLVLGYLLFRLTLYKQASLSELFFMITGMLMIAFLASSYLNPNYLVVPNHVKDDFFIKNKASFYEEEAEISTFDVIGMTTMSDTVSLLVKNDQDELARFYVPFSIVKLECESDQVTTAVRHVSVLKDLSITPEFSCTRVMIASERDNSRWYLR